MTMVFAFSSGLSSTLSALRGIGQNIALPVVFDIIDLLDDNGLFDDLINRFSPVDVDVLDVFAYTLLSALSLFAFVQWVRVIDFLLKNHLKLPVGGGSAHDDPSSNSDCACQHGERRWIRNRESVSTILLYFPKLLLTHFRAILASGRSSMSIIPRSASPHSLHQEKEKAMTDLSRSRAF